MTEEMKKKIGDRIRKVRKAGKPVRNGNRIVLNQEELGEKLGVSFQAVSSWESGKFVPDTEHLPALVKELDYPMDALFDEKDPDWKLQSVNFGTDHMFTFVKGQAQLLGLKKTLAVLELLRLAHAGQVRRSKTGHECAYTAHPLTMACHALAMNLTDDDVIAACLAHDMVEDSDGRVKLGDLPDGRVREAVRLVSKNECPHTDAHWMDRYYDEIRKNPLACLVKCLDRVNNVAGMADGFDRKWMIRYLEETDRYYPALLEVIQKEQEWNNAWWLLRYQLQTTKEAYKRLLCGRC